MLCYLDSWTSLSGSEVNDGHFVTDHLSYNRKKYRVCEVNPMVDANISRIKHELEVIVQIPMSDSESIFTPNMVEECANFFADALRKIALCQLVGRQKSNGPSRCATACKNFAVRLGPNLFYYLTNTVET
jgi:hypothetical protein